MQNSEYSKWLMATDLDSITPVNWEHVAARLGSEDISLAEAKTLLSPQGSSNLEAMAQAAHALTLKRFGKAIKLYAPVYISNSCINGCLYCGFRNSGNIKRRTLSPAEAIAEAEAIIQLGHKHILLVAGEDPSLCPIEFIEEIAMEIRPKVASLAIEVQPFNEKGYQRLAASGIDGVTLYQETYNQSTYIAMHPYGPKSHYNLRLAAIDAAGKAGMRFLGIGVLLGLSDWQSEAINLIAHARWLMKHHWRSAIAISVPRIRDSATSFKMPSPVSDRDLAQMICALRLSLPNCGIALSTRESAALRDKLLPLGITQMSAGSITSPGGYRGDKKSGEQFYLEDSRSPDEVAQMLRNSGYDPVWKDWDNHLYG